MKPKNHELLGRKWDYMHPLPELLEDLRSEDKKFSNVPNVGPRLGHISNKLMFPVLYHLGFGPVSDVRQEVEDGVDLALEYFDDVWWRPEGIDRLPPEEIKRLRLDEPEIRTDAIERASRALDKSRSDRVLKWFEPLVHGLFLAGLVERWDDIGKICSWFDATIEPEYTAGELEDEYQQLFLCIAGSLSPEPMEGADELLAKVKKCRAKRPRLLCAAWEAASAADQAAFDKAFPETVKHFLSKPEDGQAYVWVAIHQSIVWLIAEHRGLTLPAMSDKLNAAVVTRQSAGIAEG